MYGLIDYAKRFNLMRDIEIEYGTSPAMLKTMGCLCSVSVSFACSSALSFDLLSLICR